MSNAKWGVCKLSHLGAQIGPEGILLATSLQVTQRKDLAIDGGGCCGRMVRVEGRAERCGEMLCGTAIWTYVAAVPSSWRALSRGTFFLDVLV